MAPRNRIHGQAESTGEPRSAGRITGVILFAGCLAGAAAGTASAPNLNAPPISGELVILNRDFDATRLETVQARATVIQERGAAALKVVFEKGPSPWPKVHFPVPPGGWNLSAFGGVEIHVSNAGDAAVEAAMRVDNPGEWKDSPWNTEGVHLEPGEIKTIRVVFGKHEGGQAFPLDPERISSIQVFLNNPARGTTLILKDLKAVGSPSDRGTETALSRPEDRSRPPAPLPPWSGKRPPVDGDWVLTLDESFDGPGLDEKLWSLRTWWNGLLDGQTQRYSMDNLLFENGITRMKAERRPGPQYDDPALPSRDFTTGHIVSYGKWTQAYGYFEARLRLPTARGLWPAFWLMPDRGPSAGPEGWKRESTRDGGMEIDIMEHLTEWGPGRYNVACHWDGYEAGHRQWGTAHLYYRPTPDDWHTFGLLWEPGKLTWFCDGLKKAEFAHERVGTQPAYIILNVQMGGWATGDVDEKRLPDFLDIDYVRAWRPRRNVNCQSLTPVSPVSGRLTSASTAGSPAPLPVAGAGLSR